MRMALVLGLLALAALASWMSVFTVDPTEFVYVTEFGKHVWTYDGSLTDDAGLHFRWPWPVGAVRRLDRRLQHFDLPAIELLTREPGEAGDKGTGSGIDKTLTVDAYVCWRIADKDAVDRFVRRIDTPDRARAILGQRVSSQLGAFMGQMRMDELVSIELVKDNTGETVTKVDWHMDDLHQRLLKSLAKPVLDEYGIEIVDIRLRRFNHPIKVRESIFARIISERKQISARYESEGDKLAKDIRSISLSKVELLTRYAENVEKQAKAEADREAVLIGQRAYEQDVSFFLFWNELEQMKALLGSNKTKLLLASQNPMLRFLEGPPRMNGQPRPDSGGPLRDRPLGDGNPASKKEEP